MRDIVTVLLAVAAYAVFTSGFVMCTCELPWSAVADVGLMTTFMGTMIMLLALILLAVFRGEAGLDDTGAFALAYGAAGGIMFVGVVGILGGLLVAVFGCVSGLVGSLTGKCLWRLAGSN